MSVLATPRKASLLPQTGHEARLAARGGRFKGQTAGVHISRVANYQRHALLRGGGQRGHDAEAEIEKGD